MSKWQEFTVWDAPFVGSQEYDHKPTQSELLKFLDETWWKFTVDRGWHIHDTGIDYSSWRYLTGEAPPSELTEQLQERQNNTIDHD